jgi:hypothetical protein
VAAVVAYDKRLRIDVLSFCRNSEPKRRERDAGLASDPAPAALREAVGGRQ